MYCRASLNPNKAGLEEKEKVHAQLNTAWKTTESLLGFTLPQSKSNQYSTKVK